MTIFPAKLHLQVRSSTSSHRMDRRFRSMAYFYIIILVGQASQVENMPEITKYTNTVTILWRRKFIYAYEFLDFSKSRCWMSMSRQLFLLVHFWLEMSCTVSIHIIVTTVWLDFSSTVSIHIIVTIIPLGQLRLLVNVSHHDVQLTSHQEVFEESTVHHRHVDLRQER